MKEIFKILAKYKEFIEDSDNFAYDIQVAAGRIGAKIGESQFCELFNFLQYAQVTGDNNQMPSNFNDLMYEHLWHLRARKDMCSWPERDVINGALFLGLWHKTEASRWLNLDMIEMVKLKQAGSSLQSSLNLLIQPKSIINQWKNTHSKYFANKHLLFVDIKNSNNNNNNNDEPEEADITILSTGRNINNDEAFAVGASMIHTPDSPNQLKLNFATEDDSVDLGLFRGQERRDATTNTAASHESTPIVVFTGDNFDNSRECVQFLREHATHNRFEMRDYTVYFLNGYSHIFLGNSDRSALNHQTASIFESVNLIGATCGVFDKLWSYLQQIQATRQRSFGRSLCLEIATEIYRFVGDDEDKQAKLRKDMDLCVNLIGDICERIQGHSGITEEDDINIGYVLRKYFITPIMTIVASKSLGLDPMSIEYADYVQDLKKDIRTKKQIIQNVLSCVKQTV